MQLFLLAALASDAATHFENRVRPLLAERCAACHGAKKSENGLRLDTAAGLRKGGDSGPALVAGKPRESRLLLAAERHPDHAAMPPEGPPLTKEQLADLSQWIAGGAYFPEAAAPAKVAEKHWAFEPVADPKPPAAKNAGWVRQPLDAFVLAPQEAAGLAPAPDADRPALLRRASFGLTGLPPAPQELAAFLADPDPTPQAFAKQVERLLASPHYGEHWARHWLDVARYADSKGYVFQEERRYPFAFAYRDWVADALNRDLPYDRFVKLQLAADQLTGPDDTRDLAAMGFLTVGRRFLNDKNEITDDRIDVVTRGLLGLSVQCARCHDHKFDPIPAADYYSLWGVFMSSTEPKEGPLLDAKGGTPQTRDYEAKRQALEAKVEAGRVKIATSASERLRRLAPEWLRLAAETGFKADHPKVVELAKARTLSAGAYKAWLAQWLAAAGPKAPPAAKGSAVAAVRSLLDASPEAWPAWLTRFAKGTPDEQWLVGMLKTPPADRPALAAAIGTFVTTPEGAKRLAPWLAAGGPFHVKPADADAFADRKERDGLKKLQVPIAKLEFDHPGAPKRAMALLDLPQPVQPHVLLRGNPGRRGPAVPRQFLACLSGPDRKPFTQGSGRRELAEAVASPKNAVFARVFVNRAWTWHFGQPLVATPSDFGTRGEPPTHPELLDHLAQRFMASGWSVKALHRMIMASHAYQQGSAGSAAALAGDPANRLLTRFPRRRLAWEELRDALLAVAGELDRTVGGRSQPLFEKAEDGAPMRRRTLYGFIDRQNLEPTYRTFDFASPDTSSAKRFDTVAPQQGLFLLNHPFVRERAAALAASSELRAAAGDGAKVAALTVRCFGRPASADEQRLAAAFRAAEPGLADDERWTRFAQALLLANEFAFVD